jgi:hypothetical protein
LATSLTDNLGNPCRFPRHRVLRGSGLFVIPIKETSGPNLAILDLQFFILKNIRRGNVQAKDRLTLALFGPLIQGSDMLIGPCISLTLSSTTSPIILPSSLPELSNSNQILFLVRRALIAHFSRRVRVVGGDTGGNVGTGEI